jgi:TrmH family RNA methyltransferase
LSPGSVDPYNAKVVRASMGGIFHVPLELDVELASLSNRFARLACLDMTGEKPSASGFADFDCYVFGNEARGVPREQLHALLAHPFAIGGCAAVESLNLAAVVNMCVYELKR